MKVKCKICGLKGVYDSLHVIDKSRTMFIFVHSFNLDNDKVAFICRKCVSKILSSISTDQYNLHKKLQEQIEC